MKLTSSILAAALCCTASATATAHIFTHDPYHQPRREGESSPLNARLILAQRAGVEDYHTADILSTGAIEEINDYGFHQQLFGDAKQDIRRAFFLLEHTNNNVLPTLNDVTSHLTLTPAPSANSTTALFIDLARQHSPSTLTAQLSDAAVLALLRNTPTNAAFGNDYFGISNSKKDLEQSWNSLLSRKGEQWSLTALIAPEVGGGQDLWGTYAMPTSYSPLHKRQQAEEPLEEITPIEFTAPVSAIASNTTRQLPGILPACFTSLSSCETNTLNCTGHGTCQLAYTDSKRPSKSPFRSCYACVCKATVSEDSEGRITTTNWGGPGCQKKDVSASFWLIVLLSVAMAGLVSFAVGTVWSMGDETLPSVLGAGVSAPPKR